MIAALDKFKLASARSLIKSLSALQREALLKGDQYIQRLQQDETVRVQDLQQENETLLQRAMEIQNAADKVHLANAALRRENESLAKKVAVLAAAKSKAKEQETHDHPIYGKLLHDFGFKKVYATKPELLINNEKLPVWMKQRLYDSKRAEAIAKQKRKDNRFGFPGTVTVFDQKDKVRGVLDGQHRIGSLKLLVEAGAWKEGKDILTEVFTVATDKEINDLFREINKCQPVQEVDLPGVANDFLRDSINAVSIDLQERYGAMFSTSANCRLPHVNLDRLRQTLFESPRVNAIIESEKTVDAAAEKVTKFIDAANASFDKRSDEELVAGLDRKPNAKAISKCRDYSFYLGIIPNWPAAAKAP